MANNRSKFTAMIDDVTLLATMAPAVERSAATLDLAEAHRRVLESELDKALRVGGGSGEQDHRSDAAFWAGAASAIVLALHLLTGDQPESIVKAGRGRLAARVVT